MLVFFHFEGQKNILTSFRDLYVNELHFQWSNWVFILFFSWLLIEDFFLSIEIKYNTKIYNIHTFYSIN